MKKSFLKIINENLNLAHNSNFSAHFFTNFNILLTRLMKQNIFKTITMTGLRNY